VPGTKVSMARDNPYMMEAKGFTPPEFLSSERGPTSIIKTALPIGGMENPRPPFYTGHEDKTFAWTFDNVLTEGQCRELIDMANKKGYVPAFTSNNKFYAEGDPRKTDEMEYDPKRRNAFISMFDFPEFTTYLFKALETHLKSAPLPTGWRIDHINSFVRMLCYCKAGQSHPPHFDALMTYPKGKYGPDHPWSKARSFFTVFIYLTEVPRASGGSTAFFAPDYYVDDNTDTWEVKEEDIRCNCMPGRVLVFSQNLRHAGEKLHDHIKYVIRSDVMAMPVDDQ